MSLAFIHITCKYWFVIYFYFWRSVLTLVCVHAYMGAVMESQYEWKSEKKEFFFSVNLNDFSVNKDHSKVV